ncbi:MAG: nucleotidyltransferase domain-containing protein [Candidatus Paceibacterota bacterium]|jgi:predicted nucleotidyltransferase
MDKELELKINELFKKYPAIKLAYLFGSRANDTAGPTSDYDFAIYLEGLNGLAGADLRLKLQTELAQMVGSDQVDLVFLDRDVAPELKYEIIKNGRLLYEIEPARLIVEPRILNEYFDFREILRHYQLTKV